MKKISKLQLNKETIASLSKSEQGSIIGGEDGRTFLSICKSCVVSNCGSCETIDINCQTNVHPCSMEPGISACEPCCTNFDTTCP